MAGHAAIAAVSRTLKALLLDRMVGEPGVKVTIAPPDVAVTDEGGARVNLYLYEVIENASLKNQEIPGAGHAGTYGRPPLSLNLRYLLTTYGDSENLSESDLSAQRILGEAMRVLHDFGFRIGNEDDAVLDEGLTEEFERLKITLRPADLEEAAKIWSALPNASFRRSVTYEVAVVQIQTPERRPRPRPVETRRVLASVRRRPHIVSAHVTPVSATDPIGEMRARIGDEITIVAEHALAERLYVRLGGLEPIRVSAGSSGDIRIVIPDDEYPTDLDHPGPPRPIPAADLLQPGTLEIRLIAEHPADGVEGGLGRGVAVAAVDALRRYPSNAALLQLVPGIEELVPEEGPETTMLEVKGTRLWHADARTAEVIIGDAAVAIRDLGGGTPAPTPTSVHIPITEAAAALPAPAPTGTHHPLAVQIDGARSRDPVTFRLDP